MTNWRWKYFTRDELKCKATGQFVINEDALDKLERMREYVGAPLIINSAYRSPEHNKKIGGAKNSMHVQGRAFDVSIKGHNPAVIYNAAVRAGFTGFGFYRSFLHVDTGKSRSWGGYAKQYLDNTVTAPLKALSIDKETEKPNKIEGVMLSDKQKVAITATGGVVAVGSTVDAVIANPQIIAPFLSFLQHVDWRVALVIVGICVIIGGIVWWRKK
jgi:hypothetical protein